MFRKAIVPFMILATVWLVATTFGQAQKPKPARALPDIWDRE